MNISQSVQRVSRLSSECDLLYQLFLLYSYVAVDVFLCRSVSMFTPLCKFRMFYVVVDICLFEGLIILLTLLGDEYTAWVISFTSDGTLKYSCFCC